MEVESRVSKQTNAYHPRASLSSASVRCARCGGRIFYGHTDDRIDEKEAYCLQCGARGQALGWLSVPQVAQLIGLSRNGVLRRIGRGYLRATETKINGRKVWLVSVEDALAQPRGSKRMRTYLNEKVPCKHCGKLFSPQDQRSAGGHEQIFCSPKCRRDWHNCQRHEAEYQARQQAMQAVPMEKWRRCEACGKPIQPYKRSDVENKRRFCSDVCGSRWRRARDALARKVLSQMGIDVSKLSAAMPMQPAEAGS